MTPLRLAFLSLVRRRIPTVITVVSIAMSVACAGILLRLYHLSTSRFDSIVPGWQTVVGAKSGGIEILLNALNGEGVYPEFLPYVLYQSLRTGQEVHFEDGANSQPNYLKLVSPFLYFAKHGVFRVAGTEESFIATGMNGSARYSAGQWQEGGLTLGAQVAGQTGARLNEDFDLVPWLALEPRGKVFKIKVTGILQSTGTALDRMAFTDVASAQKSVFENREQILDRSIWGEKVLNYFFINLQPNGFSALENLVNRRTVGQVISVRDERRKLADLTGAGESIGMFVSVFVILLSSLSVSSLLITRFEAMNVQLAVLRAIGHSRTQIAQWLFWEGGLLGVFGVVLGAILDALIFPILRHLLGSSLPPNEVVQSALIESYPVWSVALLATTLAVVIPLLRLYRQDVHQALRN